MVRARSWALVGCVAIAACGDAGRIVVAERVDGGIDAGPNETGPNDGDAGDTGDSAMTGPCDVPFLAGWLTTGDDHTCAIDREGVSYCWGQGNRGQTARPGLDDVRVPFRVPSLGTAIVVGGGAQHTCALHADGTVECWGDNGQAQLGVGDTAPDSVVPQPTNPTERFDRLRVGGYVNCGLTSIGDLYCWGDNDLERLGADLPDKVGSPTRIRDGERFIDIAFGVVHGCAIDVDGRMTCVGTNDHGQLGVPGVTITAEWMPVASTDRFTQVCTSLDGTCAIREDGAVLCWGANEFGKIQPDGPTNDIDAPVVAADGARFVEIACGGYHTCALVDDGTLRCWGRADRRGTPDEGVATVLPGRTFTQVRANKDHSCALETNGTVWCWGRNDFGQLAYDDPEEQVSPITVCGDSADDE